MKRVSAVLAGLLIGTAGALLPIGSAAPVEVYASDLSTGLPPEGAPIAAARRAAHAYATDSGDATITTRHTML